MVIVASFTGCLKSPPVTDPCDYNPCDHPAPEAERQVIKDYLTTNNIAAIEDCSGVFYTIDVQGTGAMPTVCSNIGFQYQGRLLNGTVFETSTSPAYSSLYGLIPGWRAALPKLKVGGTMTIYIPASLAYGPAGNATIPPNSPLIFRVDLVAVQ